MKPGNDGIFWGKMIVGVSTLSLVFVLISGIVIWWPRTRKSLKNSLKITATKGWKRFWYDLHVAGGMYALIFLLAMALTGLTWSFPWYRTAFYKVFGVEMQVHTLQGHEQKGNSQKGDVRLAHQEKKREGNDAQNGERGGRPKGRKDNGEHGERPHNGKEQSGNHKKIESMPEIRGLENIHGGSWTVRNIRKTITVIGILRLCHSLIGRKCMIN